MSLQTFILFYVVMIVNGCESLIDKMIIYPTVNERIRWDMSELFNGSQLEYQFSIRQVDEFNIITPFQQQKNTEHIDSVEQIIDLATLKLPDNNAWLNHFAFIEQDVESVDIFYNSIASYKTPFFDKVISVSTVQQERCFSLQFLQYNQFIVDCGIVDGINPIHNQFLIVDLEGKKISLLNDNLKNVISAKKRQIITTYKNNNQLLIRANYEDNSQSYIESFKIKTDHTNLYSNLFTFDSSDLQIYLNDAEAQFNLLDIQVTSDSTLYILDKYYGLFVVEFTKSYDFKIIQQILPLKEELISFYTAIYLESNGNIIRYTVLLYKSTIYVYQDQQFLKIINLDYFINTHAKISIANKYIIINYKSSFYQYNLQTSNLISKTLSEGQAHYLTNPYMPDLVAISSVQAHRFYISNGYFEVLPNSKLSPIEFSTDLIAIEYNNYDINKQQCSISIQYQRLAQNEKQLFKLTQALPSVVSTPSEPFVLKSLVSGPALMYQQNPQSKSGFQVQDMWDMQVNFQLPENPTFGATLQGQENVYFLFQQSNLIIIIYECIEVTLKELRCSEYTQAPLQFALNYDNFEWWFSDNQLYLSYSDGKTLTLSTILDGQQQLLQTITQINKIDSFLVMDTSVYIVDNGAKTITCFSSFFPTLVSTVLDQDWITKMGLRIEWNPKKVFGNQFSNSHLIFVQNGDSLIIIDCHKGYTPITTIQFPYTQLEAYVAINKQSFIIVLDGYDIGLIQEYSLANLNDIYFMKELPLYISYQLSSPMNIDYCKENGYLFIRTYSFMSQKVEILQYAPNQLAHDALKKIIPTEHFIPSSTPIILSVTGNNKMYSYVNVKGESRIKCILKQPLLVISTDINNEEYISKSTLKMFIMNYWGSSQIPFEGDIVIVNTYTYIKLDESKLRETNKLYLQDKSKDYVYPLNDNWYQGQVVSFDIACNKQPKNIYFKNKVEYEKDQVIIIQDHSLKSYIQYDDNTFIIQGERQLLFMTQNDQLTKYINLQIPQNYICQQSVIGEEGTLIYSLCGDDQQQVIHVTQCINENCFPLGIKIKFSYYAQIRNVKKIGIVGKQLFILNADQENNWVGDVIMYKLSFEEQSFPLKDPVFINKQYFSVLFDLYYTDISINLFDSLAYIFILDAFRGISIIEGKVGLDGYLTLTNRFFFDMSKYIINQGIYLKDDSQFISLQYVSHYRDLILNVAMIVVTNNAPQFGIRMVFDEKIYMKVDYILNQYGSWQAQPIVLYRQGYAVIQYCSMFHKFVAVYKIPTNLNDDQVEIIRIHGGIQYQTLEPYQFNFLSGNLKLFALEQNNLIKYNIFDQSSIIIKAQTDKQLCLVTGQNDFNSQSMETIIDVYYEKDNSNLWWIILITVIGLVIIITGSVYLYKRKQPKRVFNIQLLDDQV